MEKEMLNLILRKLDSIEKEMKAMNVRQNEMNNKYDIIDERQNEMKIKYDLMDERQKEMYYILKGWEEKRPINKKVLDELTHDVARLKNHKHDIVIGTSEIKVV